MTRPGWTPSQNTIHSFIKRDNVSLGWPNYESACVERKWTSEDADIMRGTIHQKRRSINVDANIVLCLFFKQSATKLRTLFHRLLILCASWWICSLTSLTQYLFEKRRVSKEQQGWRSADFSPFILLSFHLSTAERVERTSVSIGNVKNDTLARASALYIG